MSDPLAAPKMAPVRVDLGQGAFGLANLLGSSWKFEAVANEVAQDSTHPSLLVENMVGGYAARCDRLMADLQIAKKAPGFFSPAWSILAYQVGLMNEQWMLHWSHMRLPMSAQRDPMEPR